MTVRVEFYGIPRARAGVAAIELEATRFDDALRILSVRLPEFARHCLEAGRLRPSFLANLNGRRFLVDLATPLEDGDSLLILSADVGG